MSRKEVHIFGIPVGTSDSDGDECISYLVYQWADFIPYDGFDIPKGKHICVDFEKGIIEVYLKDDIHSIDNPDIVKDFITVMNGHIARLHYHSSK